MKDLNTGSAGLVDKIKIDLRISHSKLDDDIASNIEACFYDLIRLGVYPNKNVPLTEKAVKLYIRWQYNFEGEADRYRLAYENLRDAMSLSSDYRMEREEINEQRSDYPSW